MSCLGSGLVLMGIAFLYSITGHLNMTYMHNELVKNYINHKNLVLISMGLFTVGLGVKSAMFPLHTWLPDAHSSAPTTSSAFIIIGFKRICNILNKNAIQGFWNGFIKRIFHT